MKDKVDVVGLATSLIVLVVSVDVQRHLTKKKYQRQELRSCLKDEVDFLGSRPI